MCIHVFTEDYISVQPENSEAQRRIGAKGTNSVIHVSPYGITLALQVSSKRTVFQIRRGNKVNLEFPYFSTKTYFVTFHLNRLTEMVQMRGHNICFH